MRRATGREGKLCAETPDNNRGENKQTVIRINREMSVEQIDNDGDSRVFIDLGKPTLPLAKRMGLGRMAVELITGPGPARSRNVNYKLTND